MRTMPSQRYPGRNKNSECRRHAYTPTRNINPVWQAKKTPAFYLMFDLKRDL